jgi:hypothetical protein
MRGYAMNDMTRPVHSFVYVPNTFSLSASLKRVSVPLKTKSDGHPP